MEEQRCATTADGALRFSKSSNDIMCIVFRILQIKTSMWTTPFFQYVKICAEKLNFYGNNTICAEKTYNISILFMEITHSPRLTGMEVSIYPG